MPPTLRGRRRLLALVALAGALVVTLPAAGDAPRERNAARSVSDAAEPPPGGIGGGDIDAGLRVDAATVGVSRAKLQFALPVLYIRGNEFTCPFVDTTSDGTRDINGTPITDEKCRAIYGLPVPAQYRSQSHTFTAGRFDGYVVSSPGPDPTYGELPPVTVHALVFGSIPVSATVHLAQASADGFLKPVEVKYNVLQSNFPSAPGDPVYPGYGPLPPPRSTPEGSVYPNLFLKTTIDATLSVRLSDVTVDGHRVDVGAACTTTRPARLTVRPPTGYESGTADAPGPRGTPGSFSPAQTIAPAGYFDGTADIPAFEHCGTDEQDLDPLLTELISAPGNAVSGYLPYGILNTQKATWCNVPVAHCTAEQAAGQRRMRALASAQTRRAGLSEIRTLQSKIKPSDYVMPKVKAPKNLGK